MKITEDGRTIVEAHEIAPGMIATHYVGSDSYPVMVSSVERFKSGARKGQVKAVTTVRAQENADGEWVANPGMRVLDWIDGQPIMEELHERFLARVIGPCDRHAETADFCYGCERAGQIRFETRCEGKVAWWSSLIVGYGRDYRDPSF